MDWTPEADAEITRRYPTERTKDIAHDLGVTVGKLDHRARYTLGLRKTPEQRIAGRKVSSGSPKYSRSGDYRIDRGVLERRIRKNVWVRVARLVWEAEHGQVPAGYVVAFKPGQASTVPAEITLDRLQLISRADLARRNVWHANMPPEVGQVIHLRGVLTRKINKIARQLNGDDGRSAGSADDAVAGVVGGEYAGGQDARAGGASAGSIGPGGRDGRHGES